MAQVQAAGVLSTEQSTIWSWMTTVDHKRIGIMYLATALTFFLVGGVEALMIRTQLAVPTGNVMDADLYTQLFTTHGLPMNSYPGEAASYRVLEQWADLGLGTAILPRSKLSSPAAPHRRLRDGDVEVEIFYEAVWDRESALAADIDALTDTLAGASAASRR